MTSERLQQFEDFIVQAEGNLSHVKRVLHISKLLSEKESIPYNEDVLTFAAYFHDIGFYPPYAPQGQFDHALESSKIVPDIARSFGYSDTLIDMIVEAVLNHDKVGRGTHAETRLIRNADGIDYLGFVAVARDFVKFPKDMKRAVAALRQRKETFGILVDLPYAKILAAPRIAELDHFLQRFEEESYGIY